jgi:heme exporter protein C
MIKLLNPSFIHKISDRLISRFSCFGLAVFLIGLYYALFNSPPDYQQGEMVRVMYVHVPSAWMALGIYVFVALCSFSNLVWKTKLVYILALAAAPVGAVFALITLVTGSIWGKPIWGAWWVWDARLTSMLVLFLLYLSYIVVANSGDRLMRAEKPASVLGVIGLINVPIVKFSVDIWYSLHQPASIIRLKGPAIHPSMLTPLFIMFSAFILYFFITLILRTKILIEKVKIEGGL